MLIGSMLIYSPVQVHQSIVSLGAAAKDAGERGGWAAGSAAASLANAPFKLVGQRSCRRVRSAIFMPLQPRFHIRRSGAGRAAVCYASVEFPPVQSTIDPICATCAAVVLGELLSSYEQREPLPAGQLHAIRWGSNRCPASANNHASRGLPSALAGHPLVLACASRHSQCQAHPHAAAGRTSTSALAASSRWRRFTLSWSAAAASGASTPLR